MIELAWIQLTRTDGRALPVRIKDIKKVHPVTTGAQIVFEDGSEASVGETAAAVYTAINTKWTEYTTALGNP